MRGLVLGKFLPYHLGHAHLIREARRQCDDLVVLVCSLPGDAIPGGERYQWVRRAHPDCRVVHVTEVVPQAPEEHPDFWAIWTALIARHAGPVDRVFTSEEYGDELGRRIGAEHVSVDRERRAVPVSGTALRADPAAHWRFVPREVRPWLVRRVALLGPESSGKTTLAARLAERFGTVWVPEYGREYCEARDARTLVHEDFEAIVWGQASLEDRMAADSGPVLICDTELHTTCTWSEMILGECRPWLVAAARARRYAAMLLLAPDVPWVADGTRVLELERVRHHHLIERELRDAGRGWDAIRGPFAMRERAAVEVVQRVLRRDDRVAATTTSR
jgi:NadR type nicotinamide-nucleotide adenylyltransferase